MEVNIVHLEISNTNLEKICLRPPHGPVYPTIFFNVLCSLNNVESGYTGYPLFEN